MTMRRDWLFLALIACIAATLAHHIHNARFLEEYPNMPLWLTPGRVYLAWFAATVVGIGGYLLVRGGWRTFGYCAVLAYAAYAVDGLLHYTRAPLEAHTTGMNGTIFLEAVTGALLALAVLHRMVAR